MEKIIKQINNNFLHIVMFAALFAFLGQFIPNIFYKMMPGDYFYKVRNLRVESIEYIDCPVTTLHVERYARYPTNGTRIVELQLIKPNGEPIQYKLTSDEKDKLNDTFVIETTDGYQPFNVELPLPCNVRYNQTYKWQLLVRFPIYGYMKEIEIQSEPFYLPIIK